MSAHDRIRKLAADARAEGGEQAAAEALLAEHSRVAHELLDPVLLAYVNEAVGEREREWGHFDRFCYRTQEV